MIKLIVVIPIVFFVSYCYCNCERKEDELLSVIVLFRHGDKTPKSEYFDVYPNNPWSNPKFWNHSDLGSLTARGKLKIYDRGKWLRKRYENFLPEQYSKKHVYVRASDSDRVLASAQLLLAGLFPPRGSDVWNNKLMWQPIPIHTVPEHSDAEVAQKAPCSKFEKLMNKQLKLENHQFDEVLYISKYTGEEIVSLEHIYRLYKLLRIVEENGMVLPTWAENAMPLLKKKTDILCQTYSATPEMQKFAAGPLLHAMFKHFDAVLDKSPKAPKMILYAGHSRTLTNLLVALDSFTQQPPYTATLIFELKKNCNRNLIIDIYYQPTLNGPMEEVGKNIPYQMFKERMKDITIDPVTWRKECRTGFIFRRQ